MIGENSWETGDSDLTRKKVKRGKRGDDMGKIKMRLGLGPEEGDCGSIEKSLNWRSGVAEQYGVIAEEIGSGRSEVSRRSNLGGKIE